MEPVSDSSMEKKSLFQRWLDVIEYVGNKLPSPFFLFAILGLIVLVVSAVCSGISATYIGKEGKQVTVEVINLLNPEGLRFIFTSMIHNFISFPPLGLVLVMMLAMGLAEATGFIIE